MGASHSMDLYLDRPSSETGLRRRDVKALVRCWAVIEKDLRDQSIKLFVRLLLKHPEYRRYFQTISASDCGLVKLTRVAADARVQSHFRTILTSVGSLVTAAAVNPDNLAPKYDFLALVHRHLGLTLDDFLNFRDELIEYFKTEFPHQMTPLCVGAWRTLLTRAFTEISGRIAEYHRDAPRRRTPRRHESDDDDADSTVSSVKSVGSMFETPGEMLYWENRKPFWRTQLELWGETSDDDDEEEEDDDRVADMAGSHETRRHHRWRRMWRRFTKRVRCLGWRR